MSSNRPAPSPASPPPRPMMGRGPFGGAGFAYSPTGELLQETSDAQPLAIVNIDLERVRHAQRGYPCNVRELGEDPAAMVEA